MVEVGEKGVKNKIIFTDAGINSFSIDKVIAINIDNETELSNTREDIYELESRGIQTKNSKLFKVDTCTNEQYSWESFKGRTDRKNAQDYYGDGNRGKNSKKAKTISFNDDGSQIVTYSDGTKETRWSLKDSQGKELSQQQAEYFRDSKVRDEQGNLLVVYHGTLRARVMKKNSEGTGLYPIDFDRTANHFVVYYNNGSDSYKIIKTFDLEIYDDILAELEENIKNGKIYRTSKDLRTDISRFRIEKRRSSNSDDTIAGRKPNGENGGLHRGESASEGKSSNRTSGKNQSNIKSTRKEDISSAITLRAKALPESKVRGSYIFSIKWRGEITNEKIVRYN